MKGTSGIVVSSSFCNSDKKDHSLWESLQPISTEWCLDVQTLVQSFPAFEFTETILMQSLETYSLIHLDRHLLKSITKTLEAGERPRSSLICSVKGC